MLLGRAWCASSGSAVGHALSWKLRVHGRQCNQFVWVGGDRELEGEGAQELAGQEHCVLPPVPMTAGLRPLTSPLCGGAAGVTFVRAPPAYCEYCLHHRVAWAAARWVVGVWCGRERVCAANTTRACGMCALRLLTFAFHTGRASRDGAYASMVNLSPVKCDTQSVV